MSAVNPVYIDGGFVHWSVTLQHYEKSEDTTFLPTYEKMISDRAHEILQPGPEQITNTNEMGAGAKFFAVTGFEGLKECGCKVLGRSSTNSARSYFENKVVEQIINTLGEKDLTSIRVTAFATGLLFGELVLLAKIIDKFSKFSIDKQIEFSCIGFKYETMEENFERNQAGNLDGLSWKKDIDQAVNGFTKAVRCIINLASIHFSSPIELRFFKSVDDYLQHGKTASKYKHDFLVGPDRGKTDELINKLAREGTRIAPAFFLERQEGENGRDIPYLRIINTDGKSSLKQITVIE